MDELKHPTTAGAVFLEKTNKGATQAYYQKLSLMIVLNYIYYSIYCIVTIFRSEEGGYARALSGFAFGSIPYVYLFAGLGGFSPLLKRWTVYWPVIALFLCFLLSRLYFSRDKSEYVISYFNQRIGASQKVHAFIGFIYFSLGYILLIYFS